MESVILKLLPNEYILSAIITIGILIWFIFTIFPKIINAFNTIREQLNCIEHLTEVVKENTEDIKLLKEIIAKESKNLEELETNVMRQKIFINHNLDENRLIIKTLLSVLHGLQQIGDNGVTKGAEKEIQEFLINQTHNSFKDNE